MSLDGDWKPRLLSEAINRLATTERPSVSEDEITLVCDVCGRAVRASEARVTHGRDEVQYSCTHDGEVLAAVWGSGDVGITASAVTFRIGREELGWSDFFGYDTD